MRARLRYLIGLVIVLAVPGAALAAGSWSSSDNRTLTLSWTTDNGQSAQFVAYQFSQPVTSGGDPQAEGGSCSPNPDGNHPNDLLCAYGTAGHPSGEASGTVTATTQNAVGACDQIGMATSQDGSHFTDQAPLTPTACSTSSSTSTTTTSTTTSTTTTSTTTSTTTTSTTATTPDLTHGGGAPGRVAAAALPIAVGADAGGAPQVTSYSVPGLDAIQSFFAYENVFNGGVRLALADINGDGVPDVITGPGPGAGPVVRVFDGKTGAILSQFMAFDPSLRAGVYVAGADLNGDGHAEVVVGAGDAAGSQVEVFDGKTGALTTSFQAFDPSAHGARVATGDVNGDGVPDIIVASGSGSSGLVRVFNGRGFGQLQSMSAYPSGSGAARDGAYVAAGDVNGDGHADIAIGSGAGASSIVRVIDGQTGNLIRSQTVFDPAFTGGVRVATGDVNRDGVPDVIAGAGPGGGSLTVFSGSDGHSLQSLIPFIGFRGGLFVAGMTEVGALPPTVSALNVSTQAARIDAPLTCPAASPSNCQGQAELQSAPARTTAKRHGAITTLAKGRFNVRRGRHSKIHLKVTRAGHRLLKHRRRKVRTRLVVTTRDRAGNKHVTRTALTLRTR